MKRNKSHTSKYLHDFFIYPLMNQGYIDCIESEIDHRAKIHFPANGADVNIFFNTYLENRAQRTYSDFLVDGIPIWELECRGMTEEEAQAFKNELERLNKDVKSKSKNPR